MAEKFPSLMPLGLEIEPFFGCCSAANPSTDDCDNGTDSS